MDREDTPRRSDRRLGVWLVGAQGGLATTLIAGSLAIARGFRRPIGLLTETPFFAGFAFPGFDRLVFGGHEVRRGSMRDAAREVGSDSGTIPPELVEALGDELDRIDHEIRPGVLPNAGRAISGIADAELREDGRSLERMLDDLVRDIAGFRERNDLDRVVVVNLSSTEPPLDVRPGHADLAGFERILADDDKQAVRPSMLYALAAARTGSPFLHFTPSAATLAPAIVEAFERARVPFMGRDGKTGETLVKSALAPMFKYRNLKVLSWQGYNLLGDRDGLVLSDPENLDSKVRTKDSLLANILGYDLHTHVGIDYVPSLGDQKTAWDFIHFEGFLGHRMSMQFVWQGCDAVLAAPLVLDMVRMLDHAAMRGAVGAQGQLACFFKRPFGMEEDDLHRQWHMLEDWVRREREALGLDG